MIFCPQRAVRWNLDAATSGRLCDDLADRTLPSARPGDPALARQVRTVVSRITPPGDEQSTSDVIDCGSGRQLARAAMASLVSRLSFR
jgi:hypothetical protein